MKNLSKKLIVGLGILTLPFVSAKAQLPNFEELPFHKQYIAEKYWFYQTNGADTLGKDTLAQTINKGHYDELIFLDIDRDSSLDVTEVYGMRKINGVFEKKTPHPWAYFFYWGDKKSEVIKFEEWLDFEIDGINFNEWRKEELELLEELSKPLMPYETEKKTKEI
jgi:hypothetical protein